MSSYRTQASSCRRGLPLSPQPPQLPSGARKWKKGSRKRGTQGPGPGLPGRPPARPRTCQPLGGGFSKRGFSLASSRLRAILKHTGRESASYTKPGNSGFQVGRNSPGCTLGNGKEAALIYLPMCSNETQVTNKNLLYSTGNCIQCLVITYNRRECKKRIYIYIYMYK